MDIQKTAKVISVNNKILKLKLSNCSACSSCVAHNHCAMSDPKDKIITIAAPKNSTFSIDEEVILSISASQGFYSVILGYLIPLILLILSIIITVQITQNEFIGGISGIIILIPYYFGLFLARNKLKKIFHFKVSKKDAIQ